MPNNCIGFVGWLRVEEPSGDLAAILGPAE
jgi:hypothetical protein